MPSDAGTILSSIIRFLFRHHRLLAVIEPRVPFPGRNEHRLLLVQDRGHLFGTFPDWEVVVGDEIMI